eukprot:1382248-Amphidinium_carterae.2
MARRVISEWEGAPSVVPSPFSVSYFNPRQTCPLSLLIPKGPSLKHRLADDGMMATSEDLRLSCLINKLSWPLAVVMQGYSDKALALMTTAGQGVKHGCSGKAMLCMECGICRSGAVITGNILGSRHVLS